MKKVYKKLSKEQYNRGVIFSSCLSTYREELLDDTIHEVFKDDLDINTHIDRLLDDSFFNKSQFNFNIIRR